MLTFFNWIKNIFDGIFYLISSCSFNTLFIEINQSFLVYESLKASEIKTFLRLILFNTLFAKITLIIDLYLILKTYTIIFLNKLIHKK